MQLISFSGGKEGEPTISSPASTTTTTAAARNSGTSTEAFSNEKWSLIRLQRLLSFFLRGPFASKAVAFFLARPLLRQLKWLSEPFGKLLKSGKRAISVFLAFVFITTTFHSLSLSFSFSLSLSLSRFFLHRKIQSVAKKSQMWVFLAPNFDKIFF